MLHKTSQGRTIVDGKDIEAACALLYRNWEQQTRIAALPEAIRPATRAEGYAIQAALEAYTAKPETERLIGLLDQYALAS